MNAEYELLFNSLLKHETYLRVEKTNDHVAIKNRGNTLYKKTFGPKDGNCNKRTERVATQVWGYDGSLSLAFSSTEGPYTPSNCLMSMIPQILK